MAKQRRQRRYRERKRKCRIVAQIDVPLEDVLMLEGLGYLSARREQDKEAINAALEAFLRDEIANAFRRKLEGKK